MHRGCMAALVCLAACANIQPADEEEPVIDGAPGEVDPDAAPDPADPDAAPIDYDASPPDIQTLTFGPEVFKDTYLRLSDPTFNYGGHTRMCADTTTDDRRMLIRVDVSALAPGVEVVTARLHIWTGTSTNDLSTQIYSAYPMLESWSEGTLNAAAGVASWNQRSTGTAWSTAGAGVGSRGAGQVGSFVPEAIDTEYAVDLDADMVQGWVDDAGTNFGFAILSAGEDGGCFDTSEFTTASKRPSLVVEYR